MRALPDLWESARAGKGEVPDASSKDASCIWGKRTGISIWGGKLDLRKKDTLRSRSKPAEPGGTIARLEGGSRNKPEGKGLSG